jgi:hypothetical protein
MQLYLLIATGHEEATEESVRANFEDRLVYRLSESSWIVAASGTATEVWNSLERQEGDDASTDTMIVAFTDFFGYQPSDVWSWIEARVKEKPDGGTINTG